MTTPTSEILNNAADIIETRGWRTAGEGDPWGLGSENAPLCLEGGIMAAANSGFTGRVLIETCPAAKAVYDYLDLREDVLWEWNDAYDGADYIRTASEVIEVLRATAVIEAARENSSVTEKVSA